MPAHLNTIFHTVSPNCFRGCCSPGTFSHIFCDKLYRKWKEVFVLINKLAGKVITLTQPNCLLFQNIPDIHPPPTKLIHTICVATHQTIALHCKETIVPFSQILTRIEKIKLMENIYHSINNTKRLFDLKWDPWFNYKKTPNAQIRCIYLKLKYPSFVLLPPHLFQFTFSFLLRSKFNTNNI